MKSLHRLYHTSCRYKIACVTSLFILLLLCCNNDVLAMHMPKMPPQFVETMVVQNTTISGSTATSTQNMRFSGTVVSQKNVDMKSEISGRISSIDYKPGSKVKKGQILIQIDKSIATPQLSQLKSRMELASINFNRAKDLIRDGAISKSDFDTAKANYDVVVASYNQEKAIYEKNNIKAPFDGIVGLNMVRVGDYIGTDKILFNIQQNNPIDIEFYVPESYIRDIKKDMSVYATVYAIKDKKFNGKITAIDSSVNTGNRSILVRATFNNINGELISGMYANISMDIKSKNTINVPPTVVLYQNGKQYVYKLSSDKKAHLSEIQTGHRFGNNIEILSGVSVGDTIISAGQFKVRDGEIVCISNDS